MQVIIIYSIQSVQLKFLNSNLIPDKNVFISYYSNRDMKKNWHLQEFSVIDA